MAKRQQGPRKALPGPRRIPKKDLPKVLTPEQFKKLEEVDKFLKEKFIKPKQEQRKRIRKQV